MRSANIDDVWPREEDVDREEEVVVAEASHTSAPVSARVQIVDPAERAVDAATIDMIVMERVSTLMIFMLGCVTALMIQIDRLRREVRLLRVGAPRPL